MAGDAVGDWILVHVCAIQIFGFRKFPHQKRRMRTYFSCLLCVGHVSIEARKFLLLVVGIVRLKPSRVSDFEAGKPPRL